MSNQTLDNVSVFNFNCIIFLHMYREYNLNNPQVRVDIISQIQLSHRLGMLEAHSDKCRLVPSTLQLNLCKSLLEVSIPEEIILPGFWTTISMMEALAVAAGEPAQTILASCQFQP